MKPQPTTEEAVASSPWMTVAEAAAAANVCTKTIYRAIKHQQLEATRPGDGVSIRINRAWLEDWIEIGRTLRPTHLRALPDQAYPALATKGQPRREYLNTGDAS